jgi:hypothetical protein
MIQQTKLSLTASDVTGQRRITVRDVPLDSTVGEVLDGVIPMMHLNRTGPDGRPLSVEARLDREGRHLARSERVQDALRHEDHLVLHPKIIAG